MTTPIARARWVQNSTNTHGHELVARVQDGGEVLATITERRDRGYLVGWDWSAAGQTGQADTLAQARRRARQALREASDAERV